ncbi:MAG: Gfo/Idh/MocA family oxidoreductase [Ruminococcaceae bacterium]|nr:Gfo/Idh/MocA family oxidoreductase [Oscillospiraceae bacterium]
MKNEKKIGYAVLGLGIGKAHAEAVAKSENACLVALCDKDEALLQKMAVLYPQATLYTDAEELFADPRVEIVSICLPSALHAEYAVRAMEAGKHVLVEKPLDITCERAMRIEEARVRTGKRCGVVLQNRYNLNMYPIRQAIDSGRLGELFLGTFAVKWFREQRYYDRGGWRGTWAMDGGGSLINQASHTVDLMQWLMGDVASVTSSMKIANHQIETEDVTVSHIAFKNGALGTFVSTTCAYPGVSTEIGLYGTAGSIEADADRLKLWKMSEPVEDMDEDEEEETMLERFSGGNRRAAESAPEKLYGHRHVVEDMILAVKENRDPEIMPLEGMKSLAIIEAIYRSAKEGKTVLL